MRQLLLEVFDQAYTAPSWHGTPLRGIASHDLYHAGQIQILKRLQRS